MCRFTLYLGPSIRLSKLLVEPSHSLIHQSFKSAERTEPLNGDGFGVAWYAPRLSEEPAVFHSVSPAWNNRNLHSLSRAVASPCVLAHVRAATQGSEVHMANCHPFMYGRFLMMHNGAIGEFRHVRRALLQTLTDRAFDVMRGNTDTEHMFCVFVDQLLKHGDPRDHPDPVRALAERLANTLQNVLYLVREAGNNAPCFLNVAVSDGDRAAVSRFTSAKDAPPESLYYIYGELPGTTAQEFGQRRGEEEGTAVAVSSERLTTDPRWKPVPPNHLIAFARGEEPKFFALDADAKLN